MPCFVGYVYPPAVIIRQVRTLRSRHTLRAHWSSLSSGSSFSLLSLCPSGSSVSLFTCWSRVSSITFRTLFSLGSLQTHWSLNTLYQHRGNANRNNARNQNHNDYSSDKLTNRYRHDCHFVHLKKLYLIKLLLMASINGKHVFQKNIIELIIHHHHLLRVNLGVNPTPAPICR